ncbi:MAG TPA: hypothetical protein VKT49_14575 [Bryobacteraceae bacterium]|nr:hypothetical protein [Bryobacteraceae bacterium]
MREPVRVNGLARRPIWYALASILVLLPCYWQTRIQAGDLSSHVYNAWLAGLIERGEIHELQIARQNTNLLFDLILNALFQWLGPDWAQRISVSLCVLIFVWGAFAFVSGVSGRAAWELLPCLAILAYGWTLHMGFFNFYLSLGLCFWSLAALRKPTPARVATGAVLFATAYVALALPVFWAVALIIYEFVAMKIPLRFRAHLMTGSLAVLLLVHIAVPLRFPSRWSLTQLASATGADQVLVFDVKYGYILAVLTVFWGSCLAELLFAQGGRKVARGIPMHWCVLTAAGIFAVPTSILIPGYRHALVYIAERMSLALAVCFCALVGGVPLRGIQRYVPPALALVFAVVLFRDEQHLNKFEDRVDAAVAQLPPGQRVVSAIVDSDLRANPLDHMIDRACVGRCYSYANYEPSTAAFRVRATQPNPYVISDYGDSYDMQNGRYVFKTGDLPVYSLSVTASGAITTHSLAAGEASGTSTWHVLRNEPGVEPSHQ